MQIPESPNFKVRLTLDIKRGGGSASQFYLMDMGSCWKNNGDPCDGDVTSDVTQYSEMILNPQTRTSRRTKIMLAGGNSQTYNLLEKVVTSEDASLLYTILHIQKEKLMIKIEEEFSELYS